MQPAAMRAAPFLPNLPATALEGLGSRLRSVGRDAGAVLFHKGEPGDTTIPLWLVASDLATGREVVMDRGPLAEMLKVQVPLVDIMIRPQVNTGYAFDFGRIPAFVEEGVRAARDEAGAALAAIAP